MQAADRHDLLPGRKRSMTGVKKWAWIYKTLMPKESFSHIFLRIPTLKKGDRGVFDQPT